jgi:hypothetical protein
MSSLVDYISSWWITPETDSRDANVDALSPPPLVPPLAPPLAPKLKAQPDPDISEGIVYLVSVSELLSVKLKPPKDIIPAPARNMPHITKFQLNMLNQAQLKAILSVKLKPVKKPTKPKVYAPRHPVLRELLAHRPMVF